MIGAVPPELGNFANLEQLDLAGNSLTGAIPSQLGNLDKLEWLDLSKNGLADIIPPELGNLANLERLNLTSNSLTGAIPPELGELANLARLWLFNNPHLSGSLPRSFLQLGSLGQLLIGGTGVCVPADQAFQDWLKALEQYDGSICAAGWGVTDAN